MKGNQGKRRHIAPLHRLERSRVRGLDLYRTVTRDLARRAQGSPPTLSGFDLRVAASAQDRGLLGIGRQTISTVTMKILHQEQMKLDDHRRPDHHPTIQSTSGETHPQTRSKS